MKKQIFISYKRDDKELVFKVKKEIIDNTGVDCWIDLIGIESGDGIGGKISKAIDNADVCIYMLTKAFAKPYINPITKEEIPDKPTFCGDEVIYAKGQGKRLIPVSLDGTLVKDIPCGDVRFAFTGTDYIDYENVDQRKKFYKNLRTWCGDPLGLNDLDRLEDDMESRRRTVEERKRRLQYEQLQIDEMGRELEQREQKMMKYKNAANSEQYKVIGEKSKTKNIDYDRKKILKWSGIIAGVAIVIALCGWLVYSATDNNQRKFAEKGDEYYDDQNYREAADCYLKAAEQGDTACMNKLAEMYFSGLGIGMDTVEAVKWYKKSAEIGNVTAQYRLGVFYYNIGNYDDAKRWFRVAAGHGNDAALDYCNLVIAVEDSITNAQNKKVKRSDGQLKYYEAVRKKYQTQRDNTINELKKREKEYLDELARDSDNAPVFPGW